MGANHPDGRICAARCRAGVTSLRGQHLPDLFKQDRVFGAGLIAGLLLWLRTGLVASPDGRLFLLAGFTVVAEVGNDAGLNQDAVGFIQQHAEVGYHVTVELFEHNKPLTDLDFQYLDSFGKGAADMLGRYWVYRRGFGGVRVDFGKPGLKL